MNEYGNSRQTGELSSEGPTRLVDGCLSISSELDPSAALQKIADEARRLALAQYAAVQVFETGTGPSEMVTSGFSLGESEAPEHQASQEHLLQSLSQEAPESQAFGNAGLLPGPWLSVPVSHD